MVNVLKSFHRKKLVTVWISKRNLWQYLIATAAIVVVKISFDKLNKLVLEKTKIVNVNSVTDDHSRVTDEGDQHFYINACFIDVRNGSIICVKQKRFLSKICIWL